MRKLTDTQKARLQNAVLDDTIKEFITWVWWIIFCPKKRDTITIKHKY